VLLDRGIFGRISDHYLLASSEYSDSYVCDIFSTTGISLMCNFLFDDLPKKNFYEIIIYGCDTDLTEMFRQHLQIKFSPPNLLTLTVFLTTKDNVLCKI
jgi:hypothetical protein